MKIRRLGDLFGLTSKPARTTQAVESEVVEAKPVENTASVVASPDNDAMAVSPNTALENALDVAPGEGISESVADTQTDTDDAEPTIEAEAQTSITDSGVLSLPQTEDQQSATQQVQAMDEKSGSISYTEHQLSEGRELLGDFLQRCDGSYGVIVSSIDGNPVVHRISKEIPVERLANMTSSLLALGETIARESLQKLCRFVILENRDGRVVCLRINRVLMLTCITGKQSNLGMVLNIGQKTSDGLTGVF